MASYVSIFLGLVITDEMTGNHGILDVVAFFTRENIWSYSQILRGSLFLQPSLEMMEQMEQMGQPQKIGCLEEP